MKTSSIKEIKLSEAQIELLNKLLEKQNSEEKSELMQKLKEYTNPIIDNKIVHDDCKIQ